MGEEVEGNKSSSNTVLYRYDKEVMLELIACPASHQRPSCLSHEFDKYYDVNLREGIVA